MPVQDMREQKGITRGAIPSPKLGRMVYWKSILARDCIRLLDYDPQVLSYEEFPCIISYRWKEEICHYIPDFQVHYLKKPSALIACTWTRHLREDAYLARWAAAHRWCQKWRYTFSLVTEHTLQSHRVLFRNLHQLAVHAHRTIEPQVTEYLLRTITTASQPLSLAEIIQRTPHIPAKVIPGAIWHLLAIGVLETDLAQPLHVLNMHVWMKGATHGIETEEKE